MDMHLHQYSKEHFAFWTTKEFLAVDESMEEEYVSDRIAILIGSFLVIVIVLAGLITRANS
jgi:hypothetical protein